MKRASYYILWLVICNIVIFQKFYACPQPPTSIGAYFSGTKQVGSAITFTGAALFVGAGPVGVIVGGMSGGILGFYAGDELGRSLYGLIYP